MIYPYVGGSELLAHAGIECSLVKEAQSFPEIINLVEESDFTDKQLWRILQCMVVDTENGVVNVMLTNESIHQSTLQDWTHGYGWLEYINGAHYRGPWEQMIVNLRLLRLRRKAKEFKSNALDTEIPQEFMQMANDLARLLPNDKDVQEIIAQMGTTVQRINTGYSVMDNNGGIPRCSVVIIAAETAVGKTTLAINMMSNFLKDGLKVQYISLEMQASMIATKLMQIHNHCTEAEAIEARDNLMEFAGSCMIEDKKTKLPDILASMSAHATCDVHIIDNLQNVSFGQKAYSRLAELEGMTRQIKEFAQANEKVVILLSHLNRDISKSNRPPQLSDLRGSGSIEQDADIVIMLHDPSRRNHDEDVARVAQGLSGEFDASSRECFLRKNRHGGCGSSKLMLDTKCMTFREIA